MVRELYRLIFVGGDIANGGGWTLSAMQNCRRNGEGDLRPNNRFRGRPYAALIMVRFTALCGVGRKD